jgi:hypothetical protein
MLQLACVIKDDPTLKALIVGMKHYGAMHQVLLNKLGRFDGQVALVSAGLWNHRLTIQVPATPLERQGAPCARACTPC